MMLPSDSDVLGSVSDAPAEQSIYGDWTGRPVSMADIVGESQAIRLVREAVRQVAELDTPVLIVGPAGTGKDLVAAAIHHAGRRAGRPLVRFSAAGLTQAAAEAELFGREKGVLSGAPGRRVGRLEAARAGSILVEEAAELSPPLQVGLLRAIQEHEFQRAGGNRVQRTAARWLVATRCDLQAAVQVGSFRQDLFYRLSVLPILLPPLRDRREDILPLSERFASAAALRLGRTFRRINTAAVEALMSFGWPGNVRELEACIEHAVLDSVDGAIGPENLPAALRGHAGAGSPPGSLAWRVEALEREMIAAALARSGGNVRAAARELGITARMTRYKIAKLGLDPAPFKHRR